MECNNGDVVCPKCGGGGTTTAKGVEHPITKFCDKCNGSGLVDWVTNAMAAIESNDLFVQGGPNYGTTIAYQDIPSDITFTMPDGNEVLKICENGDFYVKGNLVTKDIDAYKGFVDFLKGCGVYNK